MSVDQGKAVECMDNRDIWKRVSTATHIVNHFNQDSAAEVIAIKTLMEEPYLDLIMSRDQGRMEVRQAFHKSHGPELLRAHNGNQKKLESIQSTKNLMLA